MEGFVYGYCVIPPPVTRHVILELDSRQVIIVGDVHGCLIELQELLSDCDFDKEQDTLILVGDLVNKGPYSASVVKYARSLGAYCVRGNHEEAALSYLLEVNPKSPPSTYDYLPSLDKEDIEWLRELPYSIFIPSLNALVIHAGLIPGIPLELQSFNDLCTIRNILETRSEEDGSIVWEGTTSIDDGGDAWASLYTAETAVASGMETAPHIYFGHDAKRRLQFHPLATGLDTGCCYGDTLTAVLLPSKILKQCKAHEVYVEPGV